MKQPNDLMKAQIPTRRFKFRAWDAGEKKWLCGYDVLGGFDILGECVLLGQFPGVSISRLNDVVVMQCTGLKDKNGTEIYEGDIILAHEKLVDRPLNWIVVFAPRTAGFTMRWMDRYKKGEGEFYDKLIDPSGHGRFEVIGNIYEHPEILYPQ